MALLDPDAALRAEGDVAKLVRGAEHIAAGAGRFADRAAVSRLALRRPAGNRRGAAGRLRVAMAFTIAGGVITEADIVTEVRRPAEVEISVL
ncbi:hypothetical protein AB0F91_08990 [Amycolatopsis sp. NPDC023774]|uniref:hypothetical protein n=1 Tax=Amycolatopsis sp. NPDC023774 TaxID=3155015 RepID=UPI0033F5D955